MNTTDTPLKSIGVKTVEITSIDINTKKATLTIGLSNGNDITYEDIDVGIQLLNANEIDGISEPNIEG